MKNIPYINDEFLLNTRTARELYHRYAEEQPIIDYHCHLPPKEIAEDQRWANMTEVWLGGPLQVAADEVEWDSGRVHYGFGAGV